MSRSSKRRWSRPCRRRGPAEARGSEGCARVDESRMRLTLGSRFGSCERYSLAVCTCPRGSDYSTKARISSYLLSRSSTLSTLNGSTSPGRCLFRRRIRAANSPHQRVSRCTARSRRSGCGSPVTAAPGRGLPIRDQRSDSPCSRHSPRRVFHVGGPIVNPGTSRNLETPGESSQNRLHTIAVEVVQPVAAPPQAPRRQNVRDVQSHNG